MYPVSRVATRPAPNVLIRAEFDFMDFLLQFCGIGPSPRQPARLPINGVLKPRNYCNILPRAHYMFRGCGTRIQVNLVPSALLYDKTGRDWLIPCSGTCLWAASDQDLILSTLNQIGLAILGISVQLR
jgi:hypothetical protein